MRSVVSVLALMAILEGPPSGNQSPTAFPASAHLDDASTREALAYGERQAPAPYLLARKPGPTPPTVAVYTPFVRVALAAFVARQSGGRISIDQIPEWVRRRDVHVVVRWPDDAPTRILPDGSLVSREMPITQIGLSRLGLLVPPFFNYIPPDWVTTDLSYLKPLGGVPFSDAVGAASFARELFVEGVDVYGWWEVGRNYFPSHGYIDPVELRKWR